MSLSAVAGCLLSVAIFITRGYPGRDSGIFLYVGQLILDGRIPYRDAWDNKPPGVFYADALGLFLGRGSMAGLWLVEFASLVAAVVLSVKTLDRAFGLGAAFFGSMTWLVGMMLLFSTEGPNLTEEYAIPLKFAAFWLFLEAEDKGYAGWRGLALGLTGAVTLLFRQNLIGVPLAIAAYMLVTRGYHRQVRTLLMEWFWVLLGGATVASVVCAYFAANSALGDFFDVAFRYNFLYSATSMRERLAAALAGFTVISGSGIGVIGVASWIAGLIFLATGRQLPRDARRLLALAVLAFPIEFLLVSASIREYAHYYEAWLPVIAILAGFFASSLLGGRVGHAAGRLHSRAVTWQVALVLGMAMMPAYATITAALPIGRPPSVIAQAAAYAKNNTRPGDYVLVWGADVSINFVSQRMSPTRFMHQYPLFTRGYETPEMIGEFLAEMQAHPPALIIDTSPVNDHVPPIDDAQRAREGWKSWGPDGIYATSPDTDEMFTYLNRNYKETGLLSQGGKTVFVYERR
ncbi:MAG: glycosyltransferase family 39 protein [Actinobacteria bacterium]|nr:glycosyltransferase family 39 protein [Actinomycetota bacterium]